MVSTSEQITSTTSSESTETSVSSTSSTIISRTEKSTRATPEQTLSPTEQAAEDRKRIASDLQRWQEKFAVAADKGVQDLDGRLQDIADNLITSEVRDHGQSLATALERVVENELSTVKDRINTLAEGLPFEDVPDDEEAAQEHLLDDIRQAAILIRERAHTVREWYNLFDDELVHRVSAAVNSTLDILDNIRDLGLQEIGMRWAWMDVVTYKDWENYHALKARFEDWRHEISDVGMHHEKVEEARTLASEVLDRGMEVAQSSAKELARLKDVGKWKIAAREVGDNFDTRSDPPPTWPKPSTGSESATEGVGDVSDAEILSAESPMDTADTVSVAQTPAPLENTGEVGLESDDEVPIADQHILKTNDEGSPSQESRSVASIPTRSTETVFDGSTNEDQINREIHDSRNAWGVAAAEAIPEQVPIFQDASDPNGEVIDRGQFPEDQQPPTNKASGRYTEITETGSETLLDPSSGPEEGEQYSHAPFPSSNALYETVKSAQPLTTKPLDHVISMASSKLNEDLEIASAQFARVQSNLAATTSGHNPLMTDARRHYYEAVGLAHDHFSAFVSSASQTIYGKATQAAENLEAFVSSASEQVYGTEDPYLQQSGVISRANNSPASGGAGGGDVRGAEPADVAEDKDVGQEMFSSAASDSAS